MEAQTFKKPSICDEDIVISGMSGRFPESDTTDEFAQNLYNGMDMLTSDNRRWPTGEYLEFAADISWLLIAKS